MAEHYILEGHKPVMCEDINEWGKWFAKADRVLAQTKIGDIEISTVFLGLNHNYYKSDPPIVFETMVFGGPLDGEQERYSTWEEAAIGHQIWVGKNTIVNPDPINNRFEILDL